MRGFLMLLAACSTTQHVTPPPKPIAAPPDAPAEAPKPVDDPFASFDVFGSKVTREEIIAKYHDDLLAVIQGKQKHWELATRIDHDGDFAYAAFSAITYYSPDRTFITLDLVDKADADRRMHFQQASTSHEEKDPDGLIALWNEYEAKFTAHLKDHTLDTTAKCPAWHCLSFGHPDLAPYAEQFTKRVPAQEQALVEILEGDWRDDWRGAAAFLLAHLPNGQRVVDVELRGIRDDHSLVRNNTMRVLAMIAEGHPELAIPVGPILRALDGPTTTDRNKAGAILAALANNPANRPQILRGGKTLVAMLALRQPNNHDFAYRILKSLAGKDLGEHDTAAWRTWLAAQPLVEPSSDPQHYLALWHANLVDNLKLPQKWLEQHIVVDRAGIKENTFQIDYTLKLDWVVHHMDDSIPIAFDDEVVQYLRGVHSEVHEMKPFAKVISKATAVATAAKCHGAKIYMDDPFVLFTGTGTISLRTLGDTKADGTCWSSEIDLVTGKADCEKAVCRMP